ncbi:unnamed protein product [Camellia sinensis]
MATSVVPKVAVIGSGISGAVCASTLARNGVSVTIFDSARGPGGRMSQRREIIEDGKELLFDHGAPYFIATNADVLGLVRDWEARGLVAEWKENFGSFDFASQKFVNVEKEGLSKKYVGVPGMNSICSALCKEPGVETKFGEGVGRLEWLEDEDSWLLTGLDGQYLGHFKGVVASDKNIVSPRFTNVTGRSTPLDLKPLSLIPVKGVSFNNSEVLRWAFCNSSKPERSTFSEHWVLHSTDEYAKSVIAQMGLQKPSNAALTKVADELFQEFQNTGLNISKPFFKKAHRWGSAFPASSIATEEKCLWDGKKRLAICGDFCVSPNVEGAILSGMAAASKPMGQERNTESEDRQKGMAAAASVVMTSLSLKPSPFTVDKRAVKGLPSLTRTSSFRVEASRNRKVKTDKPYERMSHGTAVRLLYYKLDVMGSKHSHDAFKSETQPLRLLAEEGNTHRERLFLWNVMRDLEFGLWYISSGINGGMSLADGLDASGRKAKGKGVYQFVDKYGANVDGYSPIYDPDDWSPSGDVYVGGSTGLAIWAVTLAGILAGGALLVYNTSALAP